MAGHWVDVQTFYKWFDGWIRTTQAGALEELKKLQRQHDAIIDEIGPGLREMFDYMNARERGKNPPQPRVCDASLLVRTGLDPGVAPSESALFVVVRARGHDERALPEWRASA